jgi:hypothetical protein
MMNDELTALDVVRLRESTAARSCRSIHAKESAPPRPALCDLERQDAVPIRESNHVPPGCLCVPRADPKQVGGQLVGWHVHVAAWERGPAHRAAAPLHRTRGGLDNAGRAEDVAARGRRLPDALQRAEADRARPAHHLQLRGHQMVRKSTAGGTQWSPSCIPAGVRLNPKPFAAPH